MKIVKHIPNTLTLLNLLCGSLSTYFAIKGDINIAVYLIIAAAIFDFADGFSARLLKAYSHIGKELDSLADLVSFGLAPSFMLIYQFTNYTEIGENIIAFSPLVIVMGSALRLAIFNVDTRQTETFSGLPTPSSGLLIVFFSHAHLNSDVVNGIASNLYFYPFISLLLSALLVSKIPMFSLKIKDLSLKNNLKLYLFLIIAFLLIVPVILLNAPWSFWIMIVFVAYILYNTLFSLIYQKA